MSKKQLTKEEQRSNNEGLAVVLITFWIFVLYIVVTLFSSCSTSQAVYRMKDGWSTAEKKSSITGWSYQNK